MNSLGLLPGSAARSIVVLRFGPQGPELLEAHLAALSFDNCVGFDLDQHLGGQ